MLLKYFYDTALAHASYLVGCQKTGEAIVIDAGLDIEQYLAAAKTEGMRITGVAETHIHADYVSGAREMADRIGAKLYLSDEGPAEWKFEYAKEYDHQLLSDGDKFTVGNIELNVMFTPGHTPESVSFILTDRGGGADEPMGIFTGDFVFVGSIGRPDLLKEAAGMIGTAESGARDLFKSVQKFHQLPSHLQVWPAHGAGSVCGKGLGAIPSSTVGYEKLFNPALQFTDEQEFVDYILSEQPEAPKYFAVMKRVNKEGPAILGEPKLPRKQGVDALSSTVEREMVVDTTASKDFARSHVPGTISIQPKYMAMWGGSLLDYSKPVYLISSESDLPEVVRVLHKIGMNNIAGYFDASEVESAGLKTESIAQLSPTAMLKKIESKEIELIDVRGLGERQEVAPVDSVHSFLGKMFENIKQLESDKTYGFCCRSGGRSIIAASIAQRVGISDVVNLDGGVSAWEMAQLPIEGQKATHAG